MVITSLFSILSPRAGRIMLQVHTEFTSMEIKLDDPVLSLGKSVQDGGRYSKLECAGFWPIF